MNDKCQGGRDQKSLRTTVLDNDRCALNYDDKRFSILAAARSSFHLNLLEATYIKTRRPVLCRQKEFVYTLKFFR